MNNINNKVYRAGLIPYFVTESGTVELMFMVPSDATYGGTLVEQQRPDGTTALTMISQPQIAKGKVEIDEDHKQTAIREAQEELGLFRGNIIGEVHHVGTFMGRTDLHVCKIDAKDMFGEPSYETDRIEWLTMDQFMESGRPLHKPAVQACYRKICKLENIKED